MQKLVYLERVNDLKPPFGPNSSIFGPNCFLASSFVPLYCHCYNKSTWHSFWLSESHSEESGGQNPVRINAPSYKDFTFLKNLKKSLPDLLGLFSQNWGILGSWKSPKKFRPQHVTHISTNFQLIWSSSPISQKLPFKFTLAIKSTHFPDTRYKILSIFWFPTLIVGLGSLLWALTGFFQGFPSNLLSKCREGGGTGFLI